MLGVAGDPQHPRRPGGAGDLDRRFLHRHLVVDVGIDDSPCVAPSNTAPAPAPSPAPSPGASSSPASTPSASPAATPTRSRSGPPQVYLAASGPASPATTPAAASASGPVAPSASATPSPAPAQQKTQTAFLCDLRLLPSLARNLVQEVPLPPSNTNSKGTLPGPALDKYLNTWLSNDTSPIDPGTPATEPGADATPPGGRRPGVSGRRRRGPGSGSRGG